MNPYFLIFGFGYTAKALSPKLLSQGFTVVATSRKPDSQNVELIDFNCPHLVEHLEQATHLLISIPPIGDQSDLVLNQYGELIKKQAPHLQWLGYLSSTGVYGDHQGRWVDENSACIPHTAMGISRLKTEQTWFTLAQENQLPLHIFRLSGIYGPGRNALERIKQGKKYSLVKEELVFCRIHVDDIVSALIASINAPRSLAIYNIADDEPAPAHVVNHYATSLLHRAPLPLIQFSESTASSMEQEFYTNNRRVSNLKMKKELRVVLKFPSYREGLKQLSQELVES